MADSMHKFIAVTNKPENPNCTTKPGEAELSHANNVRELSDEVEGNMQHCNKNTSMCSKSVSPGCLIDSERHNECWDMNTIDTLAESNEVVDKNPCHEANNPCISVENHETPSLCENIMAFAESNEASFSCDPKKSSWMSCAAKASAIGDLAIAMQTLASRTIEDETFNQSEFVVQVVELSDRTQNLALDLYTEAQNLLTEYQHQVTHFDCVSSENSDLVDHDPGKRPPKLSDNQKKYLITLGPCQPRLTVFPKTKDSENKSKQCKFSASWYSEFPHIEYSVSSDAAFCFICSLFPRGPGRSKADQSWIKGIRAWSKMKGSLGRNKEGKLLAHFTSESHKAALMDFLNFTRTDSHVDAQLSKEMRKSLLAEEKL